LKKVSSISIDYLRSFKEYLISRNLNPNSINEYIIRLKAIFNYAEKNNLIQNNTAKDLEKLKKAKTEKEFLSIPELKKLESIDNKSEILRAFLFACYTGLRISDIQKLKYSDIENGIVKVKMQKTSEFIYIPLTDKAKELIETKIINYSGLVFNLPTLSAINNHLKKLFLMNEIHKSKVSFHMSRHSFATIGLTIGIEIEVISKILGHKDLSTTQIYAKIVNEKINKAMDKFNQL
jgi:site-specific recombinase XerD